MTIAITAWVFVSVFFVLWLAGMMAIRRLERGEAVAAAGEPRNRSLRDRPL